MTVRELIEVLKLHNPDRCVVVRGYKDGVNDVTGVEQVHLKLNAHTQWYYGNHAEVNEVEGFDVEAIRINS